jgi:hypothetical protein
MEFYDLSSDEDYGSFQESLSPLGIKTFVFRQSMFADIKVLLY